ncbi:MAG: class II glutamine amidotransferase [Patescibacteria group bacterium]|nr:class II glutamine amidotransferase [Patescibacteria group bacterium]
MCLIIHRPCNAPPIASGWLADFRTRNSDGFGAWWIENGRIQIVKTMNPLEIEPIIRKLETRNLEAGFHWRMATHGSEDIANVHPFPVPLNPKKPFALVLAHNGVLSEWAPTKSKTGPNDTLNFIDEMFLPLCKRLGFNGFFAKGDNFDKELLEFIIGNNRLLLTHECLGFSKIGGSWTNWRGLWLSNTYAWSYSQRDNLAGPIAEKPITTSYYPPHTASGYGGWTYSNGKWEPPAEKITWPFRPQSAAHAQTLSKREQKRLTKAANRAAKANPQLAAKMERGPDGLYRFPGDAPAPSSISHPGEAAPRETPAQPALALPPPVHSDSLRDTADILAGMSEPEIKLWCESEPYEAARLIHELSARGGWSKI